MTESPKLSHTPDACPPAVLLCGHGSRAPRAQAEFQALADALRSRCPDRVCEAGFLELATPTIEEGLHRLTAHGARRITVVPAMLTDGRHATRDIPDLVRTAMASPARRGTNVVIAAALGEQLVLSQAARECIEAAEPRFGPRYQRNSALLVVAGSGSAETRANAALERFCHGLRCDLGFGAAVVGYGGSARPRFSDALKQACALGFNQVLVFPYFLFAGSLLDRIRRASRAYAAAQPAVHVVHATHLHNHPLVVDAILARLHEAERCAHAA
jgi:sirohydrochlorin cobaltochelatase